MPAFEEDIESATLLAVKILGSQGRMLEDGREVTLNAILATKNLGRIWYGDLSASDTPKIIQLAKELNEEVTFVDAY